MSMFNDAVFTQFSYIINHAHHLILFVILLISILLFLRLVRKKQNFPPGPNGVPFLGYFPFLGNDPHLTFQKLSKKYGNIFSLYLGQTYVVVLNDWESVVDAFSKTATANRPPNIFSNVPNGFGLADSNGPEWVEQRRFVMKAMKDTGFGRTRWEELVQEELNEVVEIIKKHETSPIDVREFFACTFINNVMTLLFGQRLPVGHPDTELVSDCIDAVSNSVPPLGINVFLPLLGTVLSKLAFTRHSMLFKKVISFTNYTTKAIDKRLNTNRSNEKESFIDEFINEMQRQGNKKINRSLTERTLLGNTQALLVGGSETSRTSLNFILIAMAEHPEEQKRVHDELDNVLGKEGKIKWSERSRIPYTYAAMMEGMRWKTVVPINTSRMAGEDIKICGYDVPKGTTILANNWAVHNDPKYWYEPEKFIPERFLLHGEKQINFKPESYVPFSYGRRSCPGELIAMMEILLYFVNLMQKFEVLPQDGSKVKYNTILGLTYQPWNAKLRFIPRQ